jgi:hypothetical protein
MMRPKSPLGRRPVRGFRAGAIDQKYGSITIASASGLDLVGALHQHIAD